jgi:ABC-2 type transport system permease protein
VASTFGKNSAIDALIGPAHQIQTVAGFTAWRSLGVLSIVGAVWGLLAATRLLRGEEDAGRWEALLAGQTTRKWAAAQAILGVAIGAATLWGLTAVVTVIVGRWSKMDIDVGQSLFFAFALVASAVMFLAVGSLASQLAATRRQAATYGGAALGVSYALRLVADSNTRFGWLRWATPLGWVEQLRPVVAAQPLAVLPIAGFTFVLAALTISLAGKRDLGASVLPNQTTSEPHTRLLSGPVGLAVRLARPSVMAWTVAIGAFALVIGFIAKAAGTVLSSSSSAEHAIARLGAPGTGARTFLGVTFLMVALLVALMGAAQVGATRVEESTGVLDNLLVRPVRRWHWLAGRLVVTMTAFVICGLTAGVFSWLGEASQHSGVRFATLIAAGLNIISPAVLLLGFGALMFGVWPRATSIAVYGVLVWSFLIDLIGGFIGLNHWVLDSSVFHQMAVAPAVSPNWATDATLMAIGVVAATIGAVTFTYRDLQGD